MKIAALLCMMLGCLMGVTTATKASAAREPAGQYPARTVAAGYSPKQAQDLQVQVDLYLQQLGGKQTDINKIVFDGGEVLLPLPGETRAREVGASPTAAAGSVTPSSTSAGLHCPYGYLCIFHDRNYTGPEVKLYKCAPAPDLRVIWAGIGSYADNETPYTYAHFYDIGGSSIETATAGDVNPAFDWWYVHDVRAC